MSQRSCVKEVARGCLRLFGITIEGFLAPPTEWRPRHSGEALWRDVFVTLLAPPTGTFADANDGGAGITQLIKLAIGVADGESPFRGLVGCVTCIRALCTPGSFCAAK